MRILPTFLLCFHRHIKTYVCRGDLCAHEQAKSSSFFASQAKCQFLSEAFSDLLQTKLNTLSKFFLKHLSQIIIIYLFGFTSLMSPLPPGYYFHEGRDYTCSLYPLLSVNTQQCRAHSECSVHLVNEQIQIHSKDGLKFILPRTWNVTKSGM